MTAATATSRIEKRSTSVVPRRSTLGFIVVTAIDLHSLGRRGESPDGQPAGDVRAAFFHPDCTVGPGMGLRRHRVMWLTPLAGCTADRGISPLPRRTGINDSGFE